MSRAVDFANVQNVLFLRTDHLGDLLVSTPLIRQLRTALPGRRFTLVASPANAEALVGWDAIDEVRVFDSRWPLKKKWEFIKELRQTHWDLCVTLSPRTRSYLLGRLSGAPIRAGIVYSRRVLVRLLRPLWLTHAVVSRIDECMAAGQPVMHEVLQLAEIPKVLGLPASEPGPLEIPLGESSLDWAREWLAAKGDPPCLIAIHGAGKWLTQGWTAADFMTLVRAVGELRANSKILITFGPGDTALQKAVESALAEAPNSAVLCPGQLPFSHWAALFSLCDVVISPDTGAVHLAVALGRPVVSLYEANVFLRASRQFAPWQVPAGVLRWESPKTTVPLILEETLRLLPMASRKDF